MQQKENYSRKIKCSKSKRDSSVANKVPSAAVGSWAAAFLIPDIKITAGKINDSMDNEAKVLFQILFTESWFINQYAKAANVKMKTIFLC